MISFVYSLKKWAEQKNTINLFCFELVIWPGWETGTHCPVGISPGLCFSTDGVNSSRYVFKLCYPCNDALGTWKCVGAGWEVSQLVTPWAPSHKTLNTGMIPSLSPDCFLGTCLLFFVHPVSWSLGSFFLLMAAETTAVLCIQGQQQFSLHLTTLLCSGSEESSPG